MSWYVTIKPINGRNHKLELSEFLNSRGYSDDVFYYSGTWEDYVTDTYLPHLKFENYDDALAYTLTFGGECSTNPPKKHIIQENKDAV